MTDSEQDASPAEEIVPVEKPVTDMLAAEEPQIPTPEPAPRGPTFGERVRKVLLFLLRLVMVLFILAALAVGLSYGLPLLYQRYIQPVSDNTAQLEQLKTQVAEDKTTIAELQTQLAAIQSEQSRQSDSLSSLDVRVQDIRDQVVKHTQTLVALEKIINMTREDGKALNAEMTRQINLLKSMELLSRARLFMYQSNFGLARQDVQAARDLLVTLQPSTPADLADDLAEVIHRLDLTLSNLPAFPVAASDDLDIAWQVLLSGLPQTQAAPVAPTPTSVAPTPTPTMLPTVGPTPTP